MIQIHRYELESAATLNGRSSRRRFPGALIQVDGGYGCIHPWPELGDASLDQQLQALRTGLETPLTKRALICCQIDAQARREQRSLFENCIIPQSHATLVSFPTRAELDTLLADGFQAVKLKVNGADSQLVDHLRPLEGSEMKLRLDFNSTCDSATFLAFAQALPTRLKAQIDFVEDPVPFDSLTWNRLRAETGISFALDQEVMVTEPEAIDVQVWKPARSDRPAALHRLVVTSYMDHAVGQLYAAYEAARSGTTELCGLLTHPLFAPDPFFEQIHSQGPTLFAPSGTGMGFDDLLANLPWTPLH